MHFDTSGKLDLSDAERLVDIETGNIDLDDLGKILRETLDLKLMDNLIENTASAASDRIALKLNTYMSADSMSRRDLIEINMMDAAAEEILLIGLDEYTVLLLTLDCERDERRLAESGLLHLELMCVDDYMKRF